jgi:hypothetical protein
MGVNARRKKMSRWLMGISVTGAVVARCDGTETAERDGETENPARCPGPNRSCHGLTGRAANRSADPYGGVH